MDFLSKTDDLLIGQWRDAPMVSGMVEIITQYAQTEVDKPLQELERMRTLSGAEGVWLDYLGSRLGLPRPYATEAGIDERLAFEGVEGATGFGQAPFEGAVESEQTFPLGDDLYRRFLRSRAILLLADGSFDAFCRALWMVDPGATLRDNLDMTLRINTAVRWVVELADTTGALPRSAGVALEIRDRQRFGFDSSGVAFDQGAYLNAISRWGLTSKH